MRFVIQIDFSTSAAVVELGATAFEDMLTRLYLSLAAKSVWSNQTHASRTDFVLCNGPGPRDLTAIARRVHEVTAVRPVFLPERAPGLTFGF